MEVGYGWFERLIEGLKVEIGFGAVVFKNPLVLSKMPYGCLPRPVEREGLSKGS